MSPRAIKKDRPGRGIPGLTLVEIDVCQQVEPPVLQVTNAWREMKTKQGAPPNTGSFARFRIVNGLLQPPASKIHHRLTQRLLSGVFGLREPTEQNVRLWHCHRRCFGTATSRPQPTPSCRSKEGHHGRRIDDTINVPLTCAAPNEQYILVNRDAEKPRHSKRWRPNA